MVAHWTPGVGDPMALPIDQFDALLRRLPRIVKMSRGVMSDRDLVDLAHG